MRKPKQKVKLATLVDCQREISVMVERSKTRLIAPTLTLGLLQSYVGNDKTIFSERETQAAYALAVKHLQGFMGHGLHIGAKWEDAYPTDFLTREERVFQTEDEAIKAAELFHQSVAA